MPDADLAPNVAVNRTTYFLDAADAQARALDNAPKSVFQYLTSKGACETVPRMPLLGPDVGQRSSIVACAGIDDSSDSPEHPEDMMESLLSASFPHREKTSAAMPFFSCVARPVGQSEIRSSPAAQKAMVDEWSKLVKNSVFDMSTVEEWATVRRAAQHTGETIHHGSLATIVVEKNAELPRSDPSRKFKGRTVFLGDQVRDQDWQHAIFQEIASAPAAMEAGRMCDFYGTIDGHTLSTSDGVQAYVQALLRGPKTWVEIPKAHWPKEWIGRYERPVVVLRKALYGHPNAGAFWESECN